MVRPKTLNALAANRSTAKWVRFFIFVYLKVTVAAQAVSADEMLGLKRFGTFGFIWQKNMFFIGIFNRASTLSPREGPAGIVRAINVKGMEIIPLTNIPLTALLMNIKLFMTGLWQKAAVISSLPET